MSRYIYVSLFVAAILFLSSCKTQNESSNDLDLIKERGELTILTMNVSTSYFIYREDTMGYNYELARSFCDSMGLRLNVVVAENQNRLVEMLNDGEGDLIAYPVPIQKELKDPLIYCGFDQISHQVLVQRAAKGDTILTDGTQLIGKEVYTLRDFKYYQRLKNYNDELGGGIIIKCIEQDTISTEDLIEMVSKGEIKYTLSDQTLAKLNRTYYNNINISVAVSFDQRSSWAVSKNSPHLAEALNQWITQNNSVKTYENLSKKYFELSKLPLSGEYELQKDVPKGAISHYDNFFRKHAEGSDYDWQLLAAIAYHESRFRTDVTSWAGAAGLMGLMPRTARSLGLTNEQRNDPDLSIGAAVNLLGQFDKMFSYIEDPKERLKFVLAAYNGGNGHIGDARRLAKKHGANPNIWFDNVEKYALLKSKPEYYSDPVCKYGYFRGAETTSYVRNVIKTTTRFKKVK